MVKRLTSEVSPEVKEGDLVIDWQDMDVRIGIKNNEQYILVVNKKTGVLEAAFDAQFFEGIADWYYRNTYGTSVNDVVMERVIN